MECAQGYFQGQSLHGGFQRRAIVPGRGPNLPFRWKGRPLDESGQRDLLQRVHDREAMRGVLRMSSRFAIVLVFLSAAWMPAQTMPADYEGVLKTLGKQGDFKANVLKINIPRNDLKVTIDGTETPTPFGFGGWLALTRGDGMT